MRVFLAGKLSFRLLCQNLCTVRREQMPHNACKGHLSGICTSTNRAVILANIGKTVFMTKRKTRILELWYFII
ncbi:hypothetical protein DW059_01870 [Roseburia sp. AF42-8]|nr:hypothetical protein DW059_01870 [Roseburia sp. AF42-8]